MIRTPSSNRLQVTVVSQDLSGGSAPFRQASRFGRPQAAPPPQRAPSSSSLFVVLCVVLFLALVGAFFLNRLQRAFELEDAAGADFDLGGGGDRDAAKLL